MKKLYFSLILVCLCCVNLSVFAQTSTYAPGAYTYTVGVGVTSLSVQVSGAQGGGFSPATGGQGGKVSANLAVSSGQALSVFVGAVGGAYPTVTGGSSSGGGEDGGIGGTSDGGSGGGGASDIRTSVAGGGASAGSLASRVAVGGGGGGADWSCSQHWSGGTGGNPAGGNGAGDCSGAPTGGTLAGGGIGDCYVGCGANGGFGPGGAGTFFGGGGGGGYWGGGGSSGASGAGGSSFAGTGTSSVSYANGSHAGASQVIIAIQCAIPGTITGTPTVCAGATTTLSDPTTQPGGTWSSSNTAVATVNAATGVVTGVLAGTTTITYNMSILCGSSPATMTVTVNALPTVAGPGTACVGTTTTLTPTPAGGAWSSGTTTVATIGASSGVLTGVLAGTTSIIYTSAGCGSTPKVVTVNASPAAITGGTTPICGTFTTPLSDATTGGVWSSSNTALANVGSTGVVTAGSGVSGNPVISYTLPSTGCASSATLTVNALSAISGIPSMCNGFTTALADATPGGTWSSSNTGVATVGSTGIVTSVSLGSTTVNYSIASTGCTASISVAVTTPPGVFTVTGGGSYCAGTISTVHVGLSGSNPGVSYQLYNGSTPVPGAIFTGSGLTIDFGAITGGGTYGVIAAGGTACQTNMDGSVTITVIPAPTPFILSATGGGAFCAGGVGQHILLSSSVIGTNYQLFNSSFVPIGSPLPGTSGPLDFGLITAPGVYSVTGSNTVTGCTGTMANTVTISVNPAPALNIVTVTNGGAYCFGTTSTIHIGLNGSVAGNTYQLFYSGFPFGAPIVSSGGALDFGVVTAPGAYTVVATTSLGCTATMTGTATVVVNALPTVFSVTGGGQYCTGPVSVHVGLGGSVIGTNYQLFNGVGAVGGLVPGTGFSLDFGALPAGSYTVSATVGATGCFGNMTGSASITVNPLPNPFIVSGGGQYCFGNPGPHIFLSSSTVGVNYTLLIGATIVSAQPGTGGPLDFGAQTAPGSYTITGTNTLTGCIGPMTGTVTVIQNPLPNNTFTVTGGGPYCFSGTGRTVGLSGSTSGINYQLFANGIASGATFAGTGAAFSFPVLQTIVGSYTVVGTNGLTSCSSIMTGSVPVTTTPLPVIYNVTGGGGYCAGTTIGVHIGLANSDAGINYQLKNGATLVGSPLAGIGGAIDFGTDTAGSYTVVATNATTGCTSIMFGTAISFVNPLPTVYALTTSGANYCLGGAGVPVSLGNSSTGTNYQLFNGGVPVGGPVAGTGAGISFGNQTAAGNYTVVATSTSTGCTKNMTGIATIGITPLPAVYNVTSVGTNYCAGGTGVQIGLSASSVGVTYQLYNGVAVVPGANLTGTGAALNFGLQTAGVYTVVATTTATGCTNVMAGTITITTNPLPALYTISGGGNYCSGGTGVAIGLSGSTPGINYQLSTGGSPAGVPLAGTGSALNFGLQTTGGSYIVTATNPATGCSSIMIGTATVTVNPLPAQHTVINGGNYCPGGLGVDVSINGSNTGTSYQLYNGAVAVGPAMPGTNAAISFGLQTAPGTYTVVATNTGTTCSAAMTGSATVALYPLPTLFSVTGGGNYCPAGSGVHVGLSGSAVGVTYQLYNGVATVTSLIGTGVPLDFGLMTDAGTYTIVGMSSSTGCSRTMSGSVTVGLYPLPATFNVTGGGNICAGGAGMHIGLDGSQTGNSYQLYDIITAIGSPLAGTGFALDFGAQVAAGTYTIVATNGVTGCTNTMTGSTLIIVGTLPAVHTVSGGGNYCAGTGGVNVGLLASDAGINYQLYNGTTAVGLPVAGTASAISFGLQTAAGTYTVVGTNTTTNCSANMFGNAIVAINPLPVAYTITGGGNYCPGSTGVHVGLSNSAMGVSYQLYNGLIAVGAAIAGTGAPIDFGLQTAAGTYTIVGTSFSTSCVNTMSGSVAVGINTLPAVYTVSSSSSEYCAGGEGVSLLLSGSEVGVNYQLRVGSIAAGSPEAGTGLELSFGLQTAAGVYTIVATNAATGCTSNMASSAAVVINPLPTSYSVVGGGNYCPGGIGVHVGIAASHTGISYQLYLGTAPMGSPVFGTGFALDFGLQTAAGVYTVVATNPVTTCVNTMAGSAVIGISALPVVYTVTGGGSYCAGGDGVTIGLSGSNAGVTYQLFNGSSLAGSAVTGSGLPLNFGAQTLAGSYTVVAMNATTGCTNNMAGTATVVINSLPTAYAVSGGGNMCPGGSGLHVGLISSNMGVNYQLYNGTLAVGVPVPGTGLALDFGLQTTAGNYTIVATNTATSCSNNMSGSALIVLNTPPVAFTVIGGGNYCAGGTGVHIGLNSSATGISYQLYNGSTPEGFPVSGTGGPIDFGSQTATGTYSVVANNPVTGCTGNMSGTSVVTVSPLVTPSVSISAIGGDTVCSGTPVTVSATVVNGGTTPVYSWNVNGTAVVSTGSFFTYTPVAGDVVGLSLTSSATCATPAVVSGTLPLTVQPHGMPVISISSSLNPVCMGTSVTFNAVTDFGGMAPSIAWMVNGITQTNAPAFSYIPNNSDVVSAVLTSDYHCRLATNASSNSITMNVDASITPAVAILANPGTHVKQGQVVLLTATVTNGVSSPSFQWYLNGVAIPGAVGASYTVATFADLDSFTCMVTSGGGCAGLNGVSSVVLHTDGGTTGVTQINAGSSDIKLIPNPNKGIFTIKGTLGTTEDEEVTVEVSNMIGQVIYKDNIMTHGGNIDQKVQISNIANGMYILNLHSASANNVFHVVIEQ